MDVKILSLLDGARRAEGTVVIVDVFRAFTAAAIAFERGAAKIVMTAEVADALRLRKRGVGELCMGEVDGQKPDGFDFGNSPWEMSRADVRGKTLIQSTRSGTVGVSAARKAKTLFAGSLVTAAATARAVLRSKPKRVSIVAMGDKALVRNDEDELCAMYLKNLLEGRRPDVEAVRKLAVAGAAAQKYDDPARPWFHPKDREIALDVDRVAFAIRISRREGLLIAVPVTR